MACRESWRRAVFVVTDVEFLKDRMGEGRVRRVGIGGHVVVRMGWRVDFARNC